MLKAIKEALKFILKTIVVIFGIIFYLFVFFGCSEKLIEPDSDLQYCNGFNFVNNQVVQCTEVVKPPKTKCERHK